MFFWNSIAFLMIQWVLAIWSLVPLPFLNPAWTSGCSWFTYCWSLALENFEHYFASMWEEKTLESSLDCKNIQPVHLTEDQSWVFIRRTDVEAETPTLWPPDAKNWLIWKRLWSWERLRARGEGDDGGWDGWMASPTQWTWVWVNSRSWWWTGRTGMLWFMGLQRVSHDWATELILILRWVQLCGSLSILWHVRPRIRAFFSLRETHWYNKLWAIARRVRR